MNKATVFAGAVTLLCCAMPARAGVVINQEQTTTIGTNSRKSEQTIMVQGNKQKMVMGTRGSLLIDLDQGKFYVLDAASKTYFEMEIPPKGPLASAMMAATGASAQNLKKAGTSRTVAGFKCDDYQGSGKMMAGDYSVVECFSKGAPGAAQFAAYQKVMLEKLKGSAAEMSGEYPEGIPLESDATMQRKVMLGGPLAGQPPITTQPPKTEVKTVVSKTVVTKIAEQNLPADTFSIPSDYKQRELPVPGMGAGMMQRPGAPGAPGAPTGSGPPAQASPSTSP